MKTTLAAFIKDTPQGREAEAILRSCVHCGFCNATCPTYQLLGDELDGPRGRIYLIKQVLEGQEVTPSTQVHLDRCLTCRSCETTCPSGVRYGRLVDIGRHVVDARVPRPWKERVTRRTLSAVLQRPGLFAALLGLGRAARPLLPGGLARKIPAARSGSTARPSPTRARRMLVLEGCAQPALAPQINAALARVLDRLGVSLLSAPGAGCCGAVPFHLNELDAARTLTRRNIDAWWPLVEQGVEAIVMTASGCGTQVKDYGHLLADDPAYAARAKRISELTRDASEVLAAERERLAPLLGSVARGRAAYHPPCSLQHGQQIRGLAEGLLVQAGFELTPVPDSHLCCGSAGTYSLLQESLSSQLLRNKTRALESGSPEVIATANIGCLTHIQEGTAVPVRHWLELLDEALS